MQLNITSEKESETIDETTVHLPFYEKAFTLDLLCNINESWHETQNLIGMLDK